MPSILPPFPAHCEFPEVFRSHSHLQPRLPDTAESFSAPHLLLFLLIRILALMEMEPNFSHYFHKQIIPGLYRNFRQIEEIYR